MSDRTSSAPVKATDSVNDVLSRSKSLRIPTSPADVGDRPSVAGAGPQAPSPKHPATANVVELDVRDDLRRGQEPFSRIMAAVAALRDSDVLLLRAIFEPAPLFAVLAKRGLSYESQEDAHDDWRVWFWRPAVQDGGPAGSAPSNASHAVASPTPGGSEPPIDNSGDDTTSWLDVRGLEPPEPLMRTLAALETLPEGNVLVQVNSRVPQLLFPMLAERGFACEVDESRADVVWVRIWHRR